MRIAVRTTMQWCSGIGALLASALVAPAVQAEPSALYRWETADGTVAFTDESKRVPERYRESVQTIDRSVLTDYGRYTPTDANANEDYARRLEARLEGLRAANAADEAQARDEAPDAGEATTVVTSAAPARDIQRRRLYVRPDGTAYYRYYRNQASGDVSSQSLPVDPNDPNPVVTERQRVLIPGQPITQTITVVRQGDRVLSVTKPRNHYHGIDFPELSEFE